MRPSDQFLLVTVRMLQAIRRQGKLDHSLVQLLDEGTVTFRFSGEQESEYRSELAKSLVEHRTLAERMERELPSEKLCELLQMVEPNSRDAHAIRSELAYRESRA